MGNMAHNQLHTVKQHNSSFFGLVRHNVIDIYNNRKIFNLEVKIAILRVLDFFGLTTLFVSLITFNLSDAQKITTWVLIIAFGILRGCSMYQNIISKKIDNRIKKLDADIKENKLKNKN